MLSMLGQTPSASPPRGLSAIKSYQLRPLTRNPPSFAPSRAWQISAGKVNQERVSSSMPLTFSRTDTEMTLNQESLGNTRDPAKPVVFN